MRHDRYQLPDYSRLEPARIYYLSLVLFFSITQPAQNKAKVHLEIHPGDSIFLRSRPFYRRVGYLFLIVEQEHDIGLVLHWHRRVLESSQQLLAIYKTVAIGIEFIKGIVGVLFDVLDILLHRRDNFLAGGRRQIVLEPLILEVLVISIVAVVAQINTPF